MNWCGGLAFAEATPTEAISGINHYRNFTELHSAAVVAPLH
jgi:hypothetical protein